MRKTNSGTDSKDGVIVAKFRNDDKPKVMKHKSKLKDSRKYDKYSLNMTSLSINEY